MARREWDPSCKVFVGNLTTEITTQDLEDEFQSCGKIKNVWVAKNPPGFGFVEFDDPADADDAVRKMDGRHAFGVDLRVEMSHGKRRRGGGGGGGRGDRRDDYRGGGRDSYRDDYRGGRDSYRRDDYRDRRDDYRRDDRRDDYRRRSRSRSPYRRDSRRSPEYADYRRRSP